MIFLQISPDIQDLSQFAYTTRVGLTTTVGGIIHRARGKDTSLPPRNPYYTDAVEIWGEKELSFRHDKFA